MVDTPSAPLPLLAVDKLSFTRDETRIFGPLSFSVSTGEALLVQGGNGAGKTTLLRILAGLLQPDGNNNILINDRQATHDIRARFVAYLGHLPGLKADLTIDENLQHLCHLHGCRPNQRMDHAITIVGLSGYEDTPVRKLSAGQKKRLSLARMWLSPAPLWLMDEPYANLDLEGITLVNRMITAHLNHDGAALVTTHGAYAAPPVRTRVLQLGESD